MKALKEWMLKNSMKKITRNAIESGEGGAIDGIKKSMRPGFVWFVGLPKFSYILENFRCWLKYRKHGVKLYWGDLPIFVVIDGRWYYIILDCLKDISWGWCWLDIFLLDEWGENAKRRGIGNWSSDGELENRYQYQCITKKPFAVV